MDKQSERGQIFTSKTFDTLVSPGSYNLTPDDDKLEKSNTRFLFRKIPETQLTLLFFSEKNINNLQNLLKFNVFKQTKQLIDNQSTNELLIVMRSIFLQYSLHPKLLDKNMSPSEKKELLVKYTLEVQRLNDIVISDILPKLKSQIEQYVFYLKDTTNQPYQMNQPVNESIQGKKEYRSTTQVLFGGDF